MGGPRKGRGKGKGGGGARRKGGKGKGKGKGKGGKGKGGKRAGGKGAPRFSGPSAGVSWSQSRPSYVGAPPPLPEDPTAPFLNPTARPLVKVPLEFNSLRHWCDVIGNNILAEFYHMYREAKPCFTGFGTAAGDELIIDNAPPDGLGQHLLLIDRQPRIATSQRILGVGRVALKLRGGAARTGNVRSLGYVGSYLAEYSATLELRSMPPKELTGPMRAILEPKVDLPGDYDFRSINTALVPVNPSQRSAIEGLRFALEKIQGPPGTGKSTTIFHILDARVPPGQRVLVTCSRNVAVESIAQKLEGLDDWPLCVFGPKDRVGETARRYLLDTQVGGHLDERRVARVARVVAERGKELQDAISAAEARWRNRRHGRVMLAFLRWRHRTAYACRDLCDYVAAYCATVAREPEWCQQRLQVGKKSVLGDARIFLCTIASTSRMLREWEEATGEDLRVHTVIVDECGCTPESSTALLLRLRPANLVMVGDHKQLPPCSVVSPQILEGTGHTRSLLERCVLASGRVHQLREQYRMHPSISAVVSSLFYAGRLITPPHVAEARRARESRPLVWLDVQGREEAPERSYMNSAEVSACTRVCARLRERAAPGASIALLTFYRGQLDQLMRAVPSDLGVEVLTVDACQGSEFDYVVLSTVRANREMRLGFVKDPQRINVAISRARLQLFVVGSRATMSSDNDWRKVQEACAPAQPQEAQPQRPLPAAGAFVSVYDALTRQKEQEASRRATEALEEAQEGGKGGKGRTSSSRGAYSAGGGAESLMWQQSSFRSKSGSYGGGGEAGGRLSRLRNGTYQSSNIAVIGGGFRRRVDMQEMEAIARHHKASLDAPASSTYHSSKYRAPQPGEAFEAAFPDLAIAAAGPEVAPRVPGQRMPRAGDLRPATRNDEKRTRRAVQRSAGASSGSGAAAGNAGEASHREEEAYAPKDELVEWADVDEVQLFEMFPDDADAVEEALRRFAGMSHQAARALEALLARPVAAPEKAVLEGEDALDYDCAVGAEEEGWEDVGEEDGRWPSEGGGGAAEEEGEGEAEEEGEEDWWEPGYCANCGEEATADVADDGYQYCAWCWAEWPGAAASGEAGAAAAAASSAPPPSVAAPAPAAAAPPRPPAPAQPPTAAGGAAQAAPRAVPAPAAAAPAAAPAPGAGGAGPAPPPAARGGRPVERVAFFDGLDGAPRWSEAPARPEAGGKELVTLKPKSQRDDGDAAPQFGARHYTYTTLANFFIPTTAVRRWGRSQAPSIPAAAVLQPAAPSADELPAARCKRLLTDLRPQLDESSIEYIVTLAQDEEPEEARATVLELLEGHGVDRQVAEAVWTAVVAA